MVECVFCKIISGEIDSYKVHEGDLVVAFLDINPANDGHVLVVPRKHFESLEEMDEDSLRSMFLVVREIASKIKKELNPDGINILLNQGEAAGQIVKHLHVHIIPRWEGDSVKISWIPRGKEKLEEIWRKIK